MKAIVNERYGPPAVLEHTDIDEPVAGDGELLVRVHAAGVDQGVWILMTGQPHLMRIMGFGFRAPAARVRGRDLAGTVVAAGANVTGFEPGDEVFGVCDGGSYAEYTRARADQCARKPANLTFEQAAAVPVSACTALHAVRDAGRVRARQRVLVTGAGGGVGTFAVQLAKAYGAEVTGVCSTPKVDVVRSIGADHVIDHTRAELTGSYDVIVDTAGNRPLRRLRRLLSPEGTLVLVGGPEGGRWTGGMGRPLRAALLSPFLSQRLVPLMSKESAEDLHDLRDLIEAGKITPAIDRTFALPDVPQALQYLHDGHARGKLVITI